MPTMTKLLIDAGPVPVHAQAARTGGLPLAPVGFTWPSCAECEGPMQFLAHLPVSHESVLSIFMCANDPGMCDEWDAFAGGNRAFLFHPARLTPIDPPAAGETNLDEVTGLTIVSAPGDYHEAAEGHEGVCGALGGQPTWLQADETPGCPGCGVPMTHAAQLEEGHANFGGGGRGYAFTCPPCARAAFLWQR